MDSSTGFLISSFVIAGFCLLGETRILDTSNLAITTLLKLANFSVTKRGSFNLLPCGKSGKSINERNARQVNLFSSSFLQIAL